MKKGFALILMFALLLVSPLHTLAETIYDAGSATLVGDGVEIGDGDMISGFDDPETQWIEFNVTVPSSGEYAIELSYATPMDDAALLINDEVIETPPAGDWGVDPGTVEFTLDLEEGDNTIVVKRHSDYTQINYLKVLSNDSDDTTDEVDADADADDEEAEDPGDDDPEAEDPGDDDSDVEESTDEESDTLPETSTLIFNFLLIGSILMMLGFAFIWIKRRRQHA